MIAGDDDTLRDDFVPVNLQNGTSFDQSWQSVPGVMPVASGGIHAGQMHQLLHYLGEDVVLQFGGGSIGKACDEGRDFMKEGGDILKKTARRHPSLQQALDPWGEISFNYESTDTPDVTLTPTS